MEIPINQLDVSLLIALTRRYLRKQERAYQQPKQQCKTKSIYEQGRFDAHLNSIQRARALIKNLESVL